MRKRIIAGTLCVFLIVAVFFSTASLMKLNDKKREDAKQVDILTKRFSVSDEYVWQRYKEIGDWYLVKLKLLRESLSFSESEATKLYAQGYLIEDMKKAQQLSADSGVDRMKILKERGKMPNLKSWDKVIRKLKLDLRSPAERLGLTLKEIKALEKLNYTESQIFQIAVIKSKYEIDIDEIDRLVKGGMTLAEIENDLFVIKNGREIR